MTHTYRITVPGIVDVGSADTLAGLVDALKDAGFCKKMTVPKLCEIVDYLERNGIYTAPVPDDKRYKYAIIKNREVQI